jgi:AP-2 complex subunit beta-1
LQNAEKTDPKFVNRKNTLKKIIANISMGNDMAPLFKDVLGCIHIPQLEVKKMVYLYLVTYGNSNPELALDAVKKLIRVLNADFRMRTTPIR